MHRQDRAGSPVDEGFAERGREWVAKNASTSWRARHLGLWARSLQPLRPLCAPAARATAREASWPLVRDLTSAGRARRVVTGRLRDWGLGGLADTAELLVSELVTNALRHARGPVRLNLRVAGDRLLCEVEDACDADPVRRTAHRGAEGGRGIELLDLLSEAWGSHRTATGKTTWFELSAAKR
ncbi:ATP-binding protein [Streptomyces sp. NPDC059851]|uniref:ATP-binding protein n=1 Tax=Streptomyces sp. NPDC059851 TaxID=3346971 RepID=UPI0036627E4A